MTRRPTFLIVGAGLAGAKAAEALREEGFDGHVGLLGSEPERPYERPPLSKDYLHGTTSADKLYVHPHDWYTRHQVDLHLHTTVTELDRVAKRVRTSAGRWFGYDRLLIATGSTPRRLNVPGADLDNVLYLRTRADSDRIRPALGPGTGVVVVGAGWIGLETAAVARAAGADVTVLEQAEVPLARMLGSRVAGVFTHLHRLHGVDLRCGVTVTGIRARAGGDSVGAVGLADGSEVAADVVIVGVGAAPNIDLARDGGLDADNGIVVDEHLCTADPDIFAAGDVANAYHPVLGRHLRVEHWANALHQPTVAANAMVGGRSSYQRLPYFFTDQYDLGMEYTGYAEPRHADSVVIRGDLQNREFIAFWVHDARVTAGMNVNIWDVNETIARLIRSRIAVDPRALADPATSLEQLLPGPWTNR